MTSPKNSAPQAIAYQWWHDLVSENSGRHRAALARMRRAATPLEVMQEPEALRLIQRLPKNPDRVAALAGILACVRSSEKQNVARAIGRSSLGEEDSATMSEARFRRLLQTPANELMTAMRRMLQLTKGEANVQDLSAAVLYWGDRVKKDWIFQYYNVRTGRPE